MPACQHGSVQALALIVVLAWGLWLVAVGVLMALRPRYCLRLLMLMAVNLSAGNWRLNSIEQGLRLLFGMALVIRSSSSRAPWLFEAAGWFIAASSVFILVMPLRWHAAYAAWWARRLTPSALRALAPLSAVAGAALIYAAG